MAKSAHILIPSLHLGDATGDHAMQLLYILRNMGYDAHIFAQHAIGDLGPDLASLAPLLHLVHPGDYPANAELTIVEFPHWFGLAERIQHAPGARVLWYHGVTPPKLWATAHGMTLIEQSIVRTSLVQHAHLAAVASPYMAQELHEHGDYPHARIRTVPLGVDVSSFQKPPTEQELLALRSRWGLRGKRVLLYIGRIAGNKRIDLLVDAMARLAPHHPDLHLLIVGDNSGSDIARDFYQRIQQQIAERSLSERIIWTGRVPSVVPYFYLADIFALPSQHEGFGVPLIEAMATGTPVLASDSAAMPWVLGYEDGGAGREEYGTAGAGLLFAEADAADLARQVAQLLGDETLRLRLQERGRAHVERFTLDAFKANAAAVIEEAQVLANETPPVGETHPRFWGYTDVMLRDYAVASNAPLVGGLIAWLRRNLTSHLKEPYLDRMLERQVRYNLLLAEEVERLAGEVQTLRQALDNQTRQGQAEELSDE